MPVGQQHHQGVAVAVAIGLGCVNELIDLIGRQVLTRAQLGIRRSLRGDCSFFSGWGDEAQVRFGHDLRASPTATVQRIGIL
jgi:hypothetical protein